MVKGLAINESPTKESYINMSFKNIKKKNYNEINKDIYKNLIVKEILGLKKFIEIKCMYTKYYFTVRPTYEIVLKESIKNIKLFKKPFNLNGLNTNIYNTYNSLVNGDVIILIAFTLFNNIEWIHIKTTGKQGWTILNNELSNSMKLF